MSASPPPRSLLDLSPDDLAGLARAEGLAAYRARQLDAALHRRRAGDWDALTDLPKALRAKFARDGWALRVWTEADHRAAPDGLTEKWLWTREGDGARVESVLIRERRGHRRTACVSSMAGCPLGCVFCATGHGGFVRNLTAGEILEQAYRIDEAARRPPAAPERHETSHPANLPGSSGFPERNGGNRCLPPEGRGTEGGFSRQPPSGSPPSGGRNPGRYRAGGEERSPLPNLSAPEEGDAAGDDAFARAFPDDGEEDTEASAAPARGLTHIVFMGMGEPLLNLDAVLAAARRLASPGGLGLSARHVTLSTVGVPDGIRRLAEEANTFRLAVSLHAPEQALRARLLPAARRWPLDDVMDAVRAFARRASRDVTFEYCLVAGVNDRPRDAQALARLLAGLRAKANLIPLNPVAGYDGRRPTVDAVRRFRDALHAAGVPATVRVEKGTPIRAACGQLGADNA